MKLTDLLINQRTIVQLLWGEQKIEFYSDVLDTDGQCVFMTPYIHNGSALKLDVTPDKGVICNLFADDPTTGRRISWKNVELTTVDRNNSTVYLIKTHMFNNVANQDDRRLHERIIIDVKGHVFDGESGHGQSVVIHDISDIGISFYVSEENVPKMQQLLITFTDTIDEKIFDVKVQGSISRVTKGEANVIVGCRLVGDNKDYQLYGFMKRIREKNKNKIKDVVDVDDKLEEVETASSEEELASPSEEVAENPNGGNE